MNIKHSALVLSLVASAFSMSAFAQNTQPLTRAQVATDLQAYKQSGLQALSATEQGPDVNSAQYKAAMARYAEMTGKTGAVASSHLTRDQVKAEVIARKEAGLPDVVVGNQMTDYASAQYSKQVAAAAHKAAPVAQAGLTRDQVKADLQAWNDAGVPALRNGDQGIDTTSAAYKAAFARYEQLRSSHS